MARKREVVQIKDNDGVERNVEIMQLPVRDSLIILPRLSKIFSKSIGKLIGDVTKKDKLENALDASKEDFGVKEILNKELSSFDFEGIIDSLAMRLDEDVIVSTIEILAKQMFIDGKSCDKPNLEAFDDYGVPFMLKAAFHAIKLNYKDFFVELLERGDSAKKEEKKIAEPTK